jgi:hypothetical protein
MIRESAPLCMLYVHGYGLEDGGLIPGRKTEAVSSLSPTAKIKNDWSLTSTSCISPKPVHKSLQYYMLIFTFTAGYISLSD